MYTTDTNEHEHLNLPFTLERHLQHFSEHDAGAQKLLDSFHIIRDNMKNHLKSVIMLFPHYSDHSHEHSEAIISAIERLLGRTRIEKLSPSDTWMLMVCAYMHDLGMLIQGKELENDWHSDAFQRYIQNCRESFDDAIRQAADHVSGVQWVNDAQNLWPVSVYRDVILLASEFYRRKHPERSQNIPMQSDFGNYFNVVISGDGRLPPRIQDVIGKICFSHGVDFDELLRILEPIDSLFGYEFHPRFIAVMLCLGDLCDLDNGRFNKMSLEVFGNPTKINYVHYYKHESVESFVLKKDLITVNYNIKSKRIKQELARKPLFADLGEKERKKELQDVCDRILLETQNWLGMIEKLVKDIKLHWDKMHMTHIETFSPSLRYKILVDGNETVSSRKNMRFSFNNDKAYELIESYSLYNNRFVFIRELLQNSVDALKRRFWTDIRSGRWDHFLQDAKDQDGHINYSQIQPFDFSTPEVFSYYKIFMKIEHQPEKPTARFTIEDNGTGISKEDLQERVLRTGMREPDKSVEKMPDWLRPTSSFGIGLHSVFGVSNSIFVMTRTAADQTVYNINMHSSRDDGYVFMSPADEQNMTFCHSPIGTNMDIDIDVSKFADDADEDRQEFDFCGEFKDKLEECLGKSLFDISYQFNEDDVIRAKSICDDDMFRLLFDKNKRNHIFYPDQPFCVEAYDFALSRNGRYCIIWDRKESILIRYDIRTNFHYSLYCNVHCKGFSVQEAKLDRDSIVILPDYVDYWGGNTKDIIDVSRTHLSHKQIKANETIFENAAVCIAKIYEAVLQTLLNAEDIADWHKNVKDFSQVWIQKKDENPTPPDWTKMLSQRTRQYIEAGFNAGTIEQLFLWQAYSRLVVKHKELSFFLSPETNPENESDTYVSDFMESANIPHNWNYLSSIYTRIWHIEHVDISRVLGVFGQDCGFTYDNNMPSLFNATNLLDVYFSIPIINIIYLLLWTGRDISYLEEKIRRELSYLPGYGWGYGFEGKNDVGDIIFSSELKISWSDYGKIYNFLFFLRGRKIERLTTNDEKELQIVFGKEYNKRGLITYDKDSFAVYLNSTFYGDTLPVPSGLEDIAVRRRAVDKPFVKTGTYMTYLWDFFGNINETYAGTSHNDEDIGKLADEIMPATRTDKKPAADVLRKICYDRAFNTELPYNTAWDKVRDAYRNLVIKVLKAVKWLLDNEYIQPDGQRTSKSLPDEEG